MSALIENLDSLRRQFPFLNERVGEHPVVYLDNAASTQKPERVIRRMQTFMESEYANVHRGIHLLSERATTVYEATRVAVARLVNAARVEEIVFTRGTTEAVNLVVNTWGRANVKPGDVIVLTEMEHHSNLLPWQALARDAGARVEYIPIRENGDGLDVEVARDLIRQKPRLLAFGHVPNTMGCENPAAEFCALAREHGVTTFVDAAQSVGHQPVDVQAMGCDFLAMSSHKMCGPSAIGALYGRYDVLESMPPWHYGGEMVDRADYVEAATYRLPPARFEAGTPAIIEAAGWGEAIAFVTEVGLEKIREHSIELADYTADRIRSINGVRIYGPARRGSGIVAFVVEGLHPHDLAYFANERGVAIRAGHHCAQPLMRRLGTPASSRASFYLYNTRTEADRFVDVLKDAIAFFA